MAVVVQPKIRLAFLGSVSVCRSMWYCCHCIRNRFHALLERTEVELTNTLARSNEIVHNNHRKYKHGYRGRVGDEEQLANNGLSLVQQRKWLFSPYPFFYFDSFIRLDLFSVKKKRKREREKAGRICLAIAIDCIRPSLSSWQREQTHTHTHTSLRKEHDQSRPDNSWGSSRPQGLPTTIVYGPVPSLAFLSLSIYLLLSFLCVCVWVFGLEKQPNSWRLVSLKKTMAQINKSPHLVLIPLDPDIQRLYHAH